MNHGSGSSMRAETSRPAGLAPCRTRLGKSLAAACPKAAITLALIQLTLPPLTGQDLTPKAAAQQTPIAIVNATLHTIDQGTLHGGTLWFDQGLIRGVQAAGEPPSLPANTIRIDGRDLHVYPGLIGADTTIGLQEIAAVRATLDQDEVGDITPEVRAAVALNPDSTAIPVTRANGVFTVGVLPLGGLVSGRAAVAQLAGWTWEDMVIAPDCGTVLQWPQLPVRHDAEILTRAAEQRVAIDRTFRAARAYATARQADPDDSGRPPRRSARAGVARPTAGADPRRRTRTDQLGDHLGRRS